MSGIPTTTPQALRAAFTALVAGITPTFAEFQDEQWSPVEQEDPRGSDIRSFRVITFPAELDPAGIYGSDGAEKVFEMRIRVSYGGVSDENLAYDMISSDYDDIWNVLHSSPGGSAQQIPGLVRVEFPTIEFEDDESTSLVVDYVTEVHYKAAIPWSAT